MSHGSSSPHRSRRLGKPSVLAVILALALTGCTPGADAGQDKTPGQVEAERQRLERDLLEHTPATELWHSPDQLASEVSVVQDVVLAYTLKAGALFITGRHLETGDIAWERMVHPGADPSGMHLDVETVTHERVPTIAVLQPDKTEGIVVAVLNALTGEVILTWGRDFWGKRPDACGQTWCVDGIQEPTEQDHALRALRLDWDSRSFAQVDPTELDTPRPDGARYIGPGLSATGDRGPGRELIVHAKDGKIDWQEPYEQVFGKLYSSDSGWDWDAAGDEPRRILIGRGSRLHALYDERGYQEDLARDIMLVGVHEATGQVAWRRPGGDPTCSGTLPEWAFGRQGQLVLCQYDIALRTLDRTKDGSWRMDMPKLAWRAIAIDTVTGEELWSHELADRSTFIKLTSGHTNIIADDQHAVLPLAQGWTVVNLATGTVQAPDLALEPTVLCRIQRETAEILVPGEQEPYYANVPDATEPCDRDTRKHTQAIPAYGEFLRTGHDEQQIVVLSTTDGTRAYRMPASHPARR